MASSKRLFSARKELARHDDQQLAATQAYGVINQKEFERRVGRRVVQITLNLEKRRHVEKDDFIISMRSFQGGLERAWVSGCIRSSYVVLSPNADLCVGYFQYLFKSHDYIQALRATSDFIRDGQDLNFSNFSLVDLPFPPLADQQLIARFLDWHGAMTGRLIRAKRRLIGLLNEQKQSIIHRAVTRGLDPDTRLKPSGVDWLGDVPEGWEVKRLKRACRVGAGKGTVKGIGPDTLVSFLPMERVGADGSVDYAQMVPLNEIGSGFSVFRRNDVIVAKITPCFENGKGALLSSMPTEIGFGSSEFIVLRALSGLRPEFLYLLTSEGQFRRSGVEAMTGSAGQQRVSPEFIGNYVVAVPPEETQVEICEFVSREGAEFEEAVNTIKDEIGLIQEFRTRLIADVVTGQLDVRAVAATLPDLTEELAADEPLDDIDPDETADAGEDEEAAAA